VHDVGIFEAADDLKDRIDASDVGEKLVAQAFAFARAFDQAGDVNEAPGGRDNFLRFDMGANGFESGVRDRDDADVRLDGGKGIVRRESTGCGECVKECRFTDVRESDDACFHDEKIRRAVEGGEIVAELAAGASGAVRIRGEVMSGASKLIFEAEFCLPTGFSIAFLIVIPDLYRD